MTHGLVLALALAAAPAAAEKPEVSLVVVNARLVDGSGGPAVAGRSVVVSGDTILAIEDSARYAPPAGARVIDAKGRVLAPGFIDMHSHADSGLLAHPDAGTQVRQGITTLVGGQDGGCQCSLGEYFRKVEATGSAANVASTVGFGWLRETAPGAFAVA